MLHSSLAFEIPHFLDTPRFPIRCKHIFLPWVEISQCLWTRKRKKFCFNWQSKSNWFREAIETETTLTFNNYGHGFYDLESIHRPISLLWWILPFGYIPTWLGKSHEWKLPYVFHVTSSRPNFLSTVAPAVIPQTEFPSTIKSSRYTNPKTWFYAIVLPNNLQNP